MVILSYSPGDMGEVGSGGSGAPSESLDGFLDISESVVPVHGKRPKFIPWRWPA